MRRESEEKNESITQKQIQKVLLWHLGVYELVRFFSAIQNVCLIVIGEWCGKQKQ